MTTAADIMHHGARCIPATETLDRAAQLMRELGVGALPVSDPRDPGERMCGIITDRDIVVRCIAAGHDPSRVTAGDLRQGTPRWISTGATVEDVLREMGKRLVGMISEHDLALQLSDDQLAQFVTRRRLTGAGPAQAAA
ncbi:CBS domain-containing protein [Streptomyces spiralis]|uniref:CBS domain-containing protein n=1 Tax=Streptomyces spiralis TaxID=66376 RepID=UPI0036994C14